MALDEYLKAKQQRLKDVFDQFDTDTSGGLDGRELVKMIKVLLPETRTAELQYFQVVLDTNGDGKV